MENEEIRHSEERRRACVRCDCGFPDKEIDHGNYIEYLHTFRGETYPCDATKEREKENES